MTNADYLRKLTLLMIVPLLAACSCSKKTTPSAYEPLDEPMSTGSHLVLGPEGVTGDSLFDFGYAPQYSRISHAFWLHNGHDDTLRIVQVKPG